jgi:hypothetical protein
MAISTFHKIDKHIGVDEFVDYVDNNIDITSDESIVSAAPMLQALANNKETLIDLFNQDLLRYETAQGASYSQSSTILGRGQKQGFIVRTNMWPPRGNSKVRTIEGALFSYDLPHDHNFSFLTANYFGPGYETEIWECDDPSKIVGHVDEHVALTFLERTRLTPGKQMYFRRQRDIHIQYPPEEYSVSLNLMIANRQDLLADQFEFDTKNNRIVAFPEGTISSRRVFTMKMAGAIGNENTADILMHIAKTHPCRRTREAALSSSLTIVPDAHDMLSAHAETN